MLVGTVCLLRLLDQYIAAARNEKNYESSQLEAIFFVLDLSAVILHTFISILDAAKCRIVI